MPTVSMWSNRFERFGLDGLKDKMPLSKSEWVAVAVNK
jgi:hypothetical protein